MTKIALITGLTGQDGSYLSELLLKKGYKVHGVVRRASYPNTKRIDHLFREHDDRDPECMFKVTYCDLSDVSSIRNVLETFEPDEIYNLASQSHVGISFITGESTLDINANVDISGTLTVAGALDFGDLDISNALVKPPFLTLSLVLDSKFI